METIVILISTYAAAIRYGQKFADEDDYYYAALPSAKAPPLGQYARRLGHEQCD